MCKYCGTHNYRAIYKNHFGEIPKDTNGKSYQIHHIDGDHSNNSLENLKCVTIDEHYNIHYSQGDYGACYYIARSIRLTTEEISEIGRISAQKKVANGTHPFLDPIVREKAAIAAKVVNDERIKNGTHNFCGGEIQRNSGRQKVKDGTHHLLGPKHNQERIKNGTHNWLGRNHVDQQLSKGTHTSQIKITCEYCEVEIDILNYNNHHGKKCRKNPNLIIEDITTVCEYCKRIIDNFNYKKHHGDKCKLNPNHIPPIKKTCEHCKKEMDNCNYSRWHGDKCKLKCDQI